MLDRKNIQLPYLQYTWSAAFKLIGEDDSEFISDFCIFKDCNSRWHGIGIGGQGHSQDNFFHAVGYSLEQKFFYIDRVDSGRPDTEWMWAPFVADDDSGHFYLYYCHHEKGQFQLRMLVPENGDMERWISFCHPDLKEGNIAFLQDGVRDPCIFFDETVGKYLMYYSGNLEGKGYSDIFVRFSDDLIHWSEKRHVIGIPDGFTAAESPFVYRKNGIYYLFVSGFDYGRVAVYASDNPFDFGDAVRDKLCELSGHCPEIVMENGKEFILCAAVHTKTGGTPAQHDLSGVYVQELLWK